MIVSDTETTVSDAEMVDCFSAKMVVSGRRMGTKAKGYKNQCQRRAKVLVSLSVHSTIQVIVWLWIVGVQGIAYF